MVKIGHILLYGVLALALFLKKYLSIHEFVFVGMFL